MENFIGKDGFVWWVGVVEKRDDPLGLGRCKVRIFGWHTDDLKELPTDSLPWAIPVNSPNNSRTFEAPREGEYILGFFQDGQNAQSPVMLGVYAGIQAQAPNPNKGFSPQHNPETSPKLPEGVKSDEVGQPNTPPIARGVVVNTGVAKTNADRVHICDITGGIQYSVASVSLKLGEAAQKIREALAAAWSVASTSPWADQLRGILKTIKEKVKMIQKFIKNIAEKLSMIRNVIAQLGKLIEYLKSLPEKVATFLRQCLTEAMGSLKEAVANADTITSSTTSTQSQSQVDSLQVQVDNFVGNTPPGDVNFKTP